MCQLLSPSKTSPRKRFEDILHEQLGRPHRGTGETGLIFQSNLSSDFIRNLTYKLGFGEDYEVWERNQRDIAQETKVNILF